jgi:hypothetical protein
MSSRIILTRVVDYFAMWRKYRVFVDGQKVGTILYRKTEYLSVRPGRHRVQVRIDWWRSNLVSIDIAEGEDIYLECGSNLKGWRWTLAWFSMLLPKGWLWLRIAPNKSLNVDCLEPLVSCNP